ncbi:MAG: PfkB family carbohydrate kinase [Coriobacteriia bacterium]|nr:PfkB family carbohydrate kinase [Coriobacteriia bacterium]
MNKKSKALAKRTVYVFGGAIGDKLISLTDYPQEGGDVLGSELGEQMGGCGLNVLRGLAQLNVPVFPGIIMGKGPWAKRLKKEFRKLDVEAQFFYENTDNGWCLVITTPSGERTFITFMGAENFWIQEHFSKLKPQAHDLVYVSGYELLQPHNEALVEFLSKLSKKIMVYYDLGPSAASIKESLPLLWDRPNAIVSLNNDEFTQLAFDKIVHGRSKHKPGCVIHRNGKENTVLYTLEDDGSYRAQSFETFGARMVDTVGWLFKCACP